MRNKKYIVHVQLVDTEMEVPVFAEDIGQAAEWAEEAYESQGYKVNRIREAREWEPEEAYENQGYKVNHIREAREWESEE